MKIIFLPGIGADWRLFRDQLQFFQKDPSRIQALVPSWPKPRTDEGLSDYAKRWIEQDASLFNDDFCLVGMSFGGQVAIDLARWSHPQALFLISSYRKGSEIPTAFKLQAKLAQTLPDQVIRLGLTTIGMSTICAQESLHSNQENDLRAMASETDLKFFRWSVKAAAEWKNPLALTELPCPTFQIRGQSDSIIQLSKSELESDVVQLETGHHLIQYTHAEEVNQWIEENLQAVCSSGQRRII